ncbi:mitochondrial 39-S ribosomal protein L47 (MRP-L47)-domain-containing protein [Pelagophyceae sp. CCMP2097]|nr:mitochondrial 39-S ribosomal protein L47 (MRP-L47)-domain-containing protein [Pelagophyceae sp. CCMP2097]
MLRCLAARATGLVRPAVRAAPWSPPVAAPAPALARAFRAGARCLGLEEFYDARHRGRIPENPVAGRAWNASEIRRKSFDDIHKLWYVLYKERCCLLTEKMRARRHNMLLKGPMRHGTVRKSMAMIRVVLAERRAAYRLMIGKPRRPFPPACREPELPRPGPRRPPLRRPGLRRRPLRPRSSG